MIGRPEIDFGFAGRHTIMFDDWQTDVALVGLDDSAEGQAFGGRR
jgi:hypothetical protein